MNLTPEQLSDLAHPIPRPGFISDAACVSFETVDRNGEPLKVAYIRVVVRRERDRWALWFSLGIVVGYALFDIAHRVM